MVATMLRVLGYTNVRNLAGGFAGWATAGLAVETGAVVETLDVLGGLDAYISALPESFNAVKVPDLAAELVENPDLLLVDVRSVDDFAGGHIEGAINIPINELTDHLGLLPDLDEAMVIYCGSGHRSAIAMMSLNLLGYTDVRSMLGGVKAWTSAEFALAEGEVVVEPGTAPAVDPDVFALVDAYLKALPAGFYTISAQDLNVELEGGFIAGAVHIPLPEFVARASEWSVDLNQPVVIYCGSGHRSAIAMVAMQLAGYTDVKSLSGGWKAWVDGGFPVATE
jgi:rhodanese-related sulfurtransferase